MGKPMVQWVVEAAGASNIGDRVIVATPDQVIVDACKAFGAEAILTSPSHPTGTDRIAEVSRTAPADIYVNVQGDEPLINPQSIAACARPLLEDEAVPMGSVYSECADAELEDPSVVKVVTDLQGFALYFSRHALPFPAIRELFPLRSTLASMLTAWRWFRLFQIGSRRHWRRQKVWSSCDFWSAEFASECLRGLAASWPWIHQNRPNRFAGS